jgi:hypothetical protein
MDKNTIDDLFINLKNDFDIEEPRGDHQQRFLSKLNNDQVQVSRKINSSTIWKPWVGIAASFALLVLLFISVQTTETSRDLASISPEMATTQTFFTNTIKTELEKLQVEDSPEFQDMIVDALFQIELLEQDYNRLKLDLDKSGEDQRVIYAMIDNFQNRIQILQDVLTNIDEQKQQNTLNNENNSTL